MKKIELNKGERIIAAVPELCSGPGWTREVVWVYIVDADGRLREESIQPEERTPAMEALFRPAAAMHHALLRALPVTGKSE